MFFDDRLATVLRHRATGEHAARTQFRQLIDLLGNRKYGDNQSLVAAAWLRLGALGELIPPVERAAMVRERGWRFHSPELAAHLAEDEPEVASAALKRAQLEEEDWVELIPRLPIRARGFLRQREGLPPEAERILDQLGVQDRALPKAQDVQNSSAPTAAETELRKTQDDPETETATPTQDTPPAASPVTTEIGAHEEDLSAPKTAVDHNPIPAGEADNSVTGGNSEAPNTEAATGAPLIEPSGNEVTEIAALVERIADFKKKHNPAPVTNESSPRLPLEEPPANRSKRLSDFGFVVDAKGRIDWAEQPAGPMVVGRKLVAARQLGPNASGDPISKAFSARQPIQSAPITLDGSPHIAGDWIIDAQPRFSKLGGQFYGYIGRMRRPGTTGQNGTASEADRVRQLLHELRTPVNALQGFAEIIQQQLFGPAPNEYRAVAANIAGDSARILAGFDELERLARLESGVLSFNPGSADLSSILITMTAKLQTVLASRMAGFSIEDEDQLGSVQIGIDPDDAEALVWRIMATLAGGCSTTEIVAVELKTQDNKAQIWWEIPTQLLAEENIFEAHVKPSNSGLSAGLFGAGFTLRLARAEAVAAGGNLLVENNRLGLILPLLTEPSSLPSSNLELYGSEGNPQTT